MKKVPPISEFIAATDAKIAADKSKLIEHCLQSLTSQSIKLSLGEMVRVGLSVYVPQYDELIGLILEEFTAAGWNCWYCSNSLCFKRQLTPEQISLPSRELQVVAAVNAIVEHVSLHAGELAAERFLSFSLPGHSLHIVIDAMLRLRNQGWKIDRTRDKINVEVAYGSGVSATVAS